jgi:hypothetical protein
MIEENQDVFQRSMQDTMRFSLVSYFKSGNPIIDALLSTMMLTAISYIMKLLVDNTYHSFSVYDIKDTILSYFFKRNSITYEGKHSFIIAKYETSPVITTCFTDSFKALLTDVITNIKTNPTVYELQEFITSRKYNGTSTESDMYIVTQRKSFLYHKDLQIYATARIVHEGSDESKDGAKIQSDKIVITLFSYVSSIDVIQKHVDQLKTEYLETIEKSRNKKKFIYSLCKTNYDDRRSECWREYEFESTRTFSNMFFEDKADVLGKIDFFINNKEWYYENGIPYSIGFGLHGPPGTGKTSFFKCLANLTGRHIIVISLKLIKTKKQLEDFFFEDKYNESNKANSIGFDKKLIIFEDIDCIGDIVLKRDSKEKRTKRKKTISNSDSIGNVLQKLVDNEESSTEDSIFTKQSVEDPITLDDILNLWDGLKETPGRMLGISSNHYDKLDPALIRPGRIDVTIHLNNASHNIINEMFTHYYKQPIDNNKLKKIKNEFYSPAEIINCYVLYKDSPANFMDRLMKNKKF